jgi:sugar diacid utilization regulator
MEITVAEILRSELLTDAKVIAGKAGLYKPVSSVTVGEVPDIADWLKGGEVVLSTLYAVSEDPAAQLEFVSKIITKNAAALLIKTGRFLKEVQTAMVKEAEDAAFPLIEVPNEVRWTDLVREIYDSMIKTEVEIRMKGDLLDDLLAGQFKAEEIVRRAGFLGADLSGGSLAMFVDIDGFGSAINRMNMDEQAVQRLKRETLNIANWAAHTYSRKSLVSLKSDNVIIFLTPPGEDGRDVDAEAKRVAEEIKDSFSSRYEGATLSVGVGRFYSEPSDLLKTFEEARTALSIGRALGKTDAVTAFDDVGVYKLLLRVFEQAPQDLQALVDETVKPLAEYDAKHKGDLLLTLETFLANNLNLNNTSEQLFTHRHTVRYRLERISEISGLSVDKSDELEKLSLGLKASRLLTGLSSR